jgi:hypothetical protein
VRRNGEYKRRLERTALRVVCLENRQHIAGTRRVTSDRARAGTRGHDRRGAKVRFARRAASGRPVIENVLGRSLLEARRKEHSRRTSSRAGDTWRRNGDAGSGNTASACAPRGVAAENPLLCARKHRDLHAANLVVAQSSAFRPGDATKETGLVSGRPSCRTSSDTVRRWSARTALAPPMPRYATGADWGRRWRTTTSLSGCIGPLPDRFGQRLVSERGAHPLVAVRPRAPNDRVQLHESRPVKEQHD